MPSRCEPGGVSSSIDPGRTRPAVGDETSMHARRAGLGETRPMAWVLDLDGVIWLGDTPIPGAAEAVARLAGTGEPLAFVTNNSFGRRVDVEERLARHGIVADGAVVTSAMAVASLVDEGDRVLACGGPGLREELVRRGAEVVDAAALVASAERGTPAAVTAAIDGQERFCGVVGSLTCVIKGCGGGGVGDSKAIKKCGNSLVPVDLLGRGRCCVQGQQRQ